MHDIMGKLWLNRLVSGVYQYVYYNYKYKRFLPWLVIMTAKKILQTSVYDINTD